MLPQGLQGKTGKPQKCPMVSYPTLFVVVAPEETSYVAAPEETFVLAALEEVVYLKAAVAVATMTVVMLPEEPAVVVAATH